jgi:hypothetical protein
MVKNTSQERITSQFSVLFQHARLMHSKLVAEHQRHYWGWTPSSTIYIVTTVDLPLAVITIVRRKADITSRKC